MLKGWYKPLGVVLGGILCIQLSAFAAEKETKKSSVPAKKTTETSSKKETTASKEKEAAPAKQADDSKKVLATVNGENVSQEDVNQMLNRFGKQVPEEQMPAVTKQILDVLIAQKLIMQFIRDSKIEVSKADVEAIVNKVREEIKSDPSTAGKTLEQVLEDHETSIEEYKKSLAMDLSMENYLSKNLDEQKIRAYFDQNKAVYSEPQVRASHILVNTLQMKTDAELAQALEKIKKIKAEVDSGKDFAEVAKQYSDCPSKDKGGDLNPFKRKGQMVEPFAAAAFALKVGQVSNPVKTQYGYHIIKVTEIKTPSFDDVKENVKQDMMNENTQMLMKQLREKAKIEYKT